MKTKTNFNKLDKILGRHDGGISNIIPVLQEIQEAYGYLPEKIIVEYSKRTNIPLSQLYGVITFYSQFRTKPRGKFIVRVCHGTACYVSGAKEITECISKELGIEVGETTGDKLFTLETVACLGACGLAPVMMINKETFGKLDTAKVKKILKKKKHEQ